MTDLKDFDEKNQTRKITSTLVFIKQFDEYNKINSVSPLYLMIHSVTGYLKEQDENKYLILDSTDKYEKNQSGIKSKIKKINGGKYLFMKKSTQKIEFILMTIYL